MLSTSMCLGLIRQIMISFISSSTNCRAHSFHWVNCESIMKNEWLIGLFPTVSQCFSVFTCKNTSTVGAVYVLKWVKIDVGCSKKLLAFSKRSVSCGCSPVNQDRWLTCIIATNRRFGGGPGWCAVSLCGFLICGNNETQANQLSGSRHLGLGKESPSQPR